MKMNVKRDVARRHGKERKLPPLRTVSELAVEFGLSLQKLVYELANSNDAPNPVLKHHSSKGAKNTWYNPQEVREWWKKHNA